MNVRGGTQRRPSAQACISHLERRLLACLLDVNFCSFFTERPRPLVATVGGGALFCSWRLVCVWGGDVIENRQRRLHTALCGRVASLPVGKAQAGALPAAQWLLCACSFQLLSIRLNGPIQGHSCASETLAARTQSAERTLWARHRRMCLPCLPPGTPDCSEEPVVQEGVQKGNTRQQFGVHSCCALPSTPRVGGMEEWSGHAQARSSGLSLALTFTFYLCRHPPVFC